MTREPESHATRPGEADEPSASEQRPTPRWCGLWDGILPEGVGLGFVVLLGVGLVAVGLIGQLAVEQQAAADDRRAAQSLVRALAAVAGHHCGVTCTTQAATPAPAVEDSPEPAEPAADECAAIFQRLVVALRNNGNECTLRWLDPDGKVKFEHPGRAGAVAPASVERAPVTDRDGRPQGQLELGLRASNQLVTATLWRNWWLAAAATLVGFLLLYKRLRARLRPMRAIQENLRAYGSGLEHELRSLMLSDSFGQAAQAWNSLVGEIAVLKEEVQRRATREGSGDVLQKFESRRLRRMLDRVPTGVIHLNKEQCVVYANASAGEMLGIQPQAMLGMPLSALVTDANVIRALTDHGHGGGASADWVRGEADGNRALRILHAPLEGEAGQGESVVTIQDISHLHESERARDNFLYHVTHELRTPLTNIHAYAETLTRPDFDDEQTRKECYNVIISETRRLSRLVEDILSVSQLEVGSARMEMGDVDFQRLVRQCVQDHLGAADEKQIEVALKLPPKVPRLRGDKQRLAVLLTNLIGNAIKYTPKSGRVEVVVEVCEQSLSVAVTDTGIGIDPADQPHVFEKFYRSGNTNVQEISGTGLGLAIAREVARLHGGEIRLQSTPGRGSTFTVELPLPAQEN